MSLRIDRCICFDKSFAELSQIARAHGITTLPELQSKVIFGQKCQLCHPYVKRMLRTRETVFGEIVVEEG
ncbi:MAG: (2Fe-2S)-binding protein [Candidatus Sericytochromatia bacterium]